MNMRRFRKCFSSVISLLLMSSGFLINISISCCGSVPPAVLTRNPLYSSINAKQLSYNCLGVENAPRLTKQISIRQLMEEWIRQPVSRLKARFLDGGEPAPRGLLEALEADSRLGARELAASLRARARANRAEGQRLRRLLKYEAELWAQGFNLIAGVDEAGVDALAGRRRRRRGRVGARLQIA